MRWFEPKPPADYLRVPRNPFSVPVGGWGTALKKTGWMLFDYDVSMRCAGVAFYSLVSIFPTVAICVILLGMFADPGVINNWVKLLDTLVPEQVVAIVNNRLETLLAETGYNLSIGLMVSVAVALWSGSRAIGALLFALTHTHEVHESRGPVGSFVFSMILTVGSIVVMMLVLLGVAVLPALTATLPVSEYAEKITLWIRWPVLLILVFGTLTILYRIGPYRRDASWRRVMPGAAIATALWLMVSFLFSAYVENFGSYDAMFGSLAGTVILLFWLYYSVLIVILGATFNAELEYEARRRLVQSG